MTDFPHERFSVLVRRFGVEMTNDARRCKALLRDLCGERFRGETSVLLYAVEEKITNELQRAPNQVASEALIARLAARLERDRAVARDLARWSVESWALALDLRTSLPNAPAPSPDESRDADAPARYISQLAPASSGGPTVASSTALAAPSAPIMSAHILNRGVYRVRPLWGAAAAIMAIAFVGVAGIYIVRLFPLLVPSLSPPVQAPSARVQVGTMVEWSESQDGAPKSYSVGGVELTLSSEIADAGKIPVLALKSTRSGQTQLKGELGQEGDARAQFVVSNLDPRSDGPAVIFMSYTGGAHCCTRVTVLDPIGGAWKVIELGMLDGAGLANPPKDLDGDGFAEITIPDGRFFYTFGCYACSYPPFRVLKIANGVLKDLSASPRYASLYDAVLSDSQRGCEEHQNAACATFVATASRLNRRDWAWQIMLANYDHNDSWELPKTCDVPAINGGCPAGHAHAARDFPESLDFFLLRTGYTKSLVNKGGSTDSQAIVRDGANAFWSKDYVTALTKLLSLAESGDRIAQYYVGVMYLHGSGTAKNSTAAVQMLTASAKAGVADAQNFMGAINRKGEVVPKNPAEGMRWHLMAAKQNFVDAQYQIAIMYFHGEGMPEDDRKAYLWSCIAAAGGQAEPARLKVILEKRISPDEIADLQHQAKEWREREISSVQVFAE